METKRMVELYEKIGGKVIEMIPDKWEKIYLYGEVLDDSSEVYFYFISKSKNKLIYSHDISRVFKVDEGIYDDLLFELIDIIEELKEEYNNNADTVWTNLTLIINETGKFNIKYNYDDVLNSEFNSGERQVIWEYEILGINPQNIEGREIIKRYLGAKI